MAKGCCGSQCACKIVTAADSEGNLSADMLGTGTQQDPFVLRVAGLNPVTDPDILLTVTYDDFDDLGNGGTYNVKASLATTSKLDHLGDVTAPAPTNGQVLAYNSTNHDWRPVAPTTAATGAVHRDASLSGDGSTATPLGVAYQAGRGLATSTSGIGLNDQTMNSIVRHYTDSTGRSANTLAPAILNALSALDTNPGEIDFWNGTDWEPLVKISDVIGGEVHTISGPYDGRPVVLFVKQIVAVTDSNGQFDCLTSTDVFGYAGVLTAHFQTIGSVGQPMKYPVFLAPVDDGAMRGGVWDLVADAPVSSLLVTGTLTAYLY